MTDWREDLLDLLGESAEQTAGDWLGSGAAQVGFGALESDPANFAFKTMDAPFSVVRGGIGSAINVSQGEGLEGIGLEPGQAQWDVGMQEFREHEGPLGILKTPVELALNVGLDPTTWTGIGAAGKAARGLRALSTAETLAGRAGTSMALRGAARGMQAAQTINDLPAQLILPPTRAAFRQAGRGLERVRPGILADSERSLRSQRKDALRNLASNLTTNEGTTAPLMPRTQPLRTSATAPVVPNVHPSGSAPDTINTAFRESWRRLREAVTDPRIGITPGAARRARATPSWAKPSDVTLTEEHLNDMAVVGAGVMTNAITDSGGLMPRLTIASLGMQRLQDEIVKQYGAGIQPYLPHIYPRIRQKLTEQGLDADALMPSSRFTLPYGWANGVISTRRLKSLNRQIKKGTLTREEALAGLASGGITPGQPDVIDAAATMGAGFLSTLPKASDDLYRQMRPGGSWFPEATAASNGTAIIPDEFREAVWGDQMGTGLLSMDQAMATQGLRAIGAPQTFGTTREAWNAYMRHTFGAIPDDELDALADMSTEVLYDAYINAANDVSGNSGGARLLAQNVITDPDTGEAILDPAAFRKPQRRVMRDADGRPILDKRGKPKTEVIPGTGGALAGTHHAKTGVLGREPGDIGSEAAQAILRSIDVPTRREELAAWYAPFSSSKQALAVSNVHGRVPQPIFYGEQLRQAIARSRTTEGEDVAAVLARTPMPTKEDVSAILEKKGALTVPRMKAALEALGEEPLRTTNPAGGLLPNLEQLVELFQRGAPLQLSPITGDAKNWYGETARELEAIVGTGNYEDVTFLLDVIGITSASTEVSENAELALRALSEWKFGKDDALRKRFGLTGQQFDEARNAGHLRADMMQTHRTGIERAVNEYIRRRNNPKSLPQPVQVKPGSFAPKTFDYAGSFLANVWRDQMEKALGPNSPARKAFDEALALFTVDRHMNRIDFGPTDVGEIDYLLSRERGLLAGKVAGLSGEEAQAAGWYWARDRQGFLREIRADSDLAFALRAKIEDAWNAAPPKPGEIGDQTGGRWEDLVEQIAAKGGFDLNDPAQRTEAVRQVYDLVRQEITYRLLKQSFAKPEVIKALRAAGFPTTVEGMQRQMLGVIRRGAVGLTSDELPFYGQDPAFTGAELSPEDAERQRQLLAGADDIDATNTDGLFNQTIKEPVMEEYAARSLKSAAEAVGEKVDDLTDPDWPDRAVAKQMGYDPRLTVQENELLQTKVTVGKQTMSYKQFIDTHKLKARTDMATLREAGVSWGAYASPEQRTAAAGGDAKLEQIIADWNKEGIDILAAGDPNQVAVSLLDRAIDKDEGIEAVRNSGYDLFKAAWGEQALLSPKYHTGNFSGAWIQNALAGVLTNPLATGREVWTALKVIRAGSDQITKQEALASLKATQIAQKWGLEGMPVEVMRGGIRALTMGEEIHGPSAMGEVVGRLTRSQTLGRKAGWIFAANNDLALAVDTATRGPVWGQTLDDVMERQMVVWEAEVARRGSHIPGFDPARPPDLRPDAIKRHLMDQGMQDGVAENLMRSYVHMRGQALKEARSELNRVQFYGSRTNLDEMVGKIIPFHYWISRATRYYFEEAVRHPFLVLNYMRLSDGMEDALNDPGLSARQKGFIKILGTPLGFSLLMNPDALFGVTKAFGLTETYEADGETELGGALNWLKVRGVGLYPWIDGTINLMGMYGNTFEPDLLSLRHKALVGSAVQFARAHLGFDPAAAPYATAMGQARYAVSSFVSGVLPWLSEPVTPRTGGSSQEATLDTLIESVIIEEMKAANPNVTNGEILEIMSDPDSPEYEAAYRTVSEAGLTTQLLNFTAPVRFTMRHDARDVRMAQVDAVQEEADRLGKAPWEVAPTLEDVDFLARYKATTGKDYQPADYETAKLEHDLSRAPLAAKPLLLAEAEYHTIGSPKQRGHYEAYYALLKGDDPAVAGMSETGRQEMAAQYLDAHPRAREAVDAIHAQRDDYEQAHPEFAEFRSWQQRMDALRIQYGGTLTEYRRQAALISPNAARYFEEQQAYILRDEPDPLKYGERLDQATRNMGAFLAVTGKSDLRSVQGPFPGVPPVDLALPNMQTPTPAYGGYGGGNQTDWRAETRFIY